MKLITQACKRGGYRLTEQGREVMDRFVLWFGMVEQEALKAAQKTLPWKVREFPESRSVHPLTGSKPAPLNSPFSYCPADL